jgi:putative phosphoribosyl transferase
MSLRHPTILQTTVSIPLGASAITGHLVSPADSKGTILFSHGCGSGRFSPLNRSVARQLNHVGFTTLLLDLVSPTEHVPDDRSIPLGAGVHLLAARLGVATDWAMHNLPQPPRPIGYFGSYAGGCAAFIAAAAHHEQVNAIVCWGGCLHLAGDSLSQVTAPTLLLVCDEDYLLNDINRDALVRLSATPKSLVTLPGESQVFEDAQKLQHIGRLASAWFLQHMHANSPPVA